jgi:formylglycine-generating enzyme required for sulfatase activity
MDVRNIWTRCAAAAAVVTCMAVGTAAAQSGAFRDCDVCPVMVPIPAGSFTMGSPQWEEGREDDEGPQRTVAVSAFHLGRTEVTVGQFRAFVAATNHQTDAERDIGEAGCWGQNDDILGAGAYRANRNWRRPPAFPYRQADDEPVVCVSWNDAQAYVQWLRDRTGRRYHLPTEAQWEYAARAGTSTARHWGDNPNDACAYANVADTGILKDPRREWNPPRHECHDRYFFTAPVASYAPNRFGLHDMLGNVWEWTFDCYIDSYRGAPSDARAREEAGCSRRVVRGGGWNTKPARVRSANRNRNGTTNRGDYLGFRVASTAPGRRRGVHGSRASAGGRPGPSRVAQYPPPSWPLRAATAADPALPDQPLLVPGGRWSPVGAIWVPAGARWPALRARRASAAKPVMNH